MQGIKGGLLIGALIGVAIWLDDSYRLLGGLCVLFAVGNLFHAYLAGRKAGFPLLGLAILSGGVVGGALFAWMLLSPTPIQEQGWQWVLLVAISFASVVLWYTESKKQPERWARLKQETESSPIWDIVTGGPYRRMAGQ